jgi:hypothetical protein
VTLVEQARITLLPEVLALVLVDDDQAAAKLMDRTGGLTGNGVSWFVNGKRSVTIHAPIPLRATVRFVDLFPAAREHATPLGAAAFLDAHRLFRDAYEAREDLFRQPAESAAQRRADMDVLTARIVTTHAALKEAHARALSTTPVTGTGQAVLF